MRKTLVLTMTLSMTFSGLSFAYQDNKKEVQVEQEKNATTENKDTVSEAEIKKKMDDNIIEPKVLSIKDFEFNWSDDQAPGDWYTEIKTVEGFGQFGLYFMAPGFQTTVFSIESEDDKTADEYYGPCYEFYYLISGEVTMYWGKDASKVKEGKSSSLLLEAGDFGSWEKEWKYSAKNTGNIPAMFFWGLAEAPEGTAIRWPL